MKTTRQHEASGLGAALTGEQDFGLRIKTIRQARELTLEQVAELSGVSISTLSKIEKGQVSASFDTIAKIASAFDYSLAELFADELPAPSVASTAIQGRRTYTLAGKGLAFTNPYFRYEVHAAELLVKGMIPVVMGIETRELPPPEAWSQHAGEEFIYVLSGEVMLHTQLYAPLRLAQGDSAYIDSTMRHTFVRLSEAAASLISICQTETLDIEDLTRSG
ncbi:helix-turn-helix domain-containing protein [Pantoea sp. Acro-805]|uniref:Helix-turn-helix domain-containing protein n=1 Tax=Candidatus Pantoea formicae TaxID=2608355 RepID=A0ABX0QTW3_9GAMM|nr:XRE family transcriptional regulator [Pantoea formicae]MDF7649061.1 XRE family transcriptional regulator [Erwiniaceae bacterium L1_54_3]NIE98585.1 helix-turn-helix domain-containing protein [Pantoea formicae]